MPTKTRATVERLRPDSLRSKPVRLPQVFGDPDEILRLVRDRAPYKHMVAFHGSENKIGYDEGEFAWFLGRFDDDLFLNNPVFLDAAKEAFSAAIVRPTSLTLNLNGPTKSQPPHVDLPVFRGFQYPDVPTWMLMSMSYSRLFLPWLVPVASGLVWFYRGNGGEFEYWPDGPQSTAAREVPPLWNVGVMSDNEVMWHRVAPIGPEAEQERLHGHLRASDMMHHVGDGSWEIRDRDRTVTRLDPDEIRISMLWKAYVFQNEDHVASFENPAMNLDLDQVTEMFLEDLDGRGVRVTRPADPLTDPSWQRLLFEVYVPPFS